MGQRTPGGNIPEADAINTVPGALTHGGGYPEADAINTVPTGVVMLLQMFLSPLHRRADRLPGLYRRYGPLH